MPNLVSVDVSVTDGRVSLVFSHRAVAAAYASYLKAEDARQQQRSPSFSPQHSPQLNNHNPYRTIHNNNPLSGYHRSPQFSPTTKEVTFHLPSFITWFITCRLPDDEDAVTFSFIDADEQVATKWAESMLLFELVPPSPYDDVKQLHVRRLWNKGRLIKLLEDLQQQTTRPGSGGSWQQGGPVQGLNVGFNAGAGYGGYAGSGGKTNSTVTSPRGSVRGSPTAPSGPGGYGRMNNGQVNGFGVAHAGQKRARDVWW
ncbi:hypothetical protein B0T21DRAFT_412699 [Apiosordaria backusii]|uniref:Uncharacterized protein n=1 Tax=Apiosordaria backusii TaxID=314023 RepID=A0AA40BDY9_9PEZI|nr:hypothetical protein B0T21DRAFT_412699 [Apiosordaria backusii]